MPVFPYDHRALPWAFAAACTENRAQSLSSGFSLGAPRHTKAILTSALRVAARTPRASHVEPDLYASPALYLKPCTSRPISHLASPPSLAPSLTFLAPLTAPHGRRRRWFALFCSSGSPPSACWNASAAQQCRVRPPRLPRLSTARARRLRLAASAVPRTSPSCAAAMCMSAEYSPSATS